MHDNNTVNIACEQHTILTMADDMAAAATTFNSHGYEVFIQSREAFKAKLKEIFEKS